MADLDTQQTVLTASGGGDQAAASAVASLRHNARTVTGANLKGPVRIVSLKELQEGMAATLRAQAAQEAELVARARAQEAAARAEAERAWTAENNALHQRIAELERQLAEAEAAKRGAVEQARADGARRIAELEKILASDDARNRVVFLEKEVVRLQALVDRYEAGLEFVTAVERTDIAAELTAIETLKPAAPPALAARLDQIALGLRTAGRAIDEGLKAINGERKGTLYGVADLIEHSVSLVHLRNEAISIGQALAK